MAQVVIPPKMDCPACGSKIVSASVFCSQCGANLASADPKPPKPSARRWQDLSLNVRCAIVAGTLLVIAYLASAISANVTQARLAIKADRASDDLQRAITGIPSGLSSGSANAGRRTPITQSERMERQLVIDTYEKARANHADLVRRASDPNSGVSQAEVDLSKWMLDMAEMSKRQSDIDWQRRQESLR